MSTKPGQFQGFSSDEILTDRRAATTKRQMCPADVFLHECPNSDLVAARGLKWLADTLRDRAARVEEANQSSHDGTLKLNTTTISDALGCTYASLINRARADGYRYGLAVRWVKFLFSLPHLCAGTTTKSLAGILGVANYSDFVRNLTGERPSTIASRITLRPIEHWIALGKQDVFAPFPNNLLGEASQATTGQLNRRKLELCLDKMKRWIAKYELEWDPKHILGADIVSERMTVLRKILHSGGEEEGSSNDDILLETMQVCITAIVHADTMLSAYQSQLSMY